MSASLRARAERAQINLIRLSASKLVDDTRVRLVVPLRQVVATATIAEIIAAKLVVN